MLLFCIESSENLLKLSVHFYLSLAEKSVTQVKHFMRGSYNEIACSWSVCIESENENSAYVPSIPPSVGRMSKPNLGGYRNKLTGVVYHHAKVQTDPPPWRYSLVERFCRETQTAESKDETLQTTRDEWTQMEIPHLYPFPCHDEKYLQYSGRCIKADEIKRIRVEAAITIQKYWRRWLAIRERERREEEIRRRVEWDRRQILLRLQEEKEWLQELEYRKNHPRSKDDFLLLFSEMDKWYKGEVASLKKRKWDAELKGYMYMLSDKERQKIQEIDSERSKLKVEQSLEPSEAFLSKISAEKMWKAGDTVIPVHTPETLKARYLKDLYKTLSKLDLTPEDRADALEELKEAVKEYESQLTDDICALANREIDLLKRGTKLAHLAGLRMRIRNSFWQFVCLPDVNPQADVSQVHNASGKPKHIVTCSSCSQYSVLPPDTFEAAAHSSVLQQRFMKCPNCKYLENEGWVRKDLEVYKRMLKLLHEAEEKCESASGIIYLLQPHDICYMVEKIWQSQSCISGIAILKDLEFTRWNPAKNWTPWNSILLTRIEAHHHRSLIVYKEMYDQRFRRKIYLKHLAARRYISNIPRFIPYLDDDFDVVSDVED